VTGWIKRTRMRTDDVPTCSRTAAWLASTGQPRRPVRLIHNDFKFRSLVLDPTT
jgi:aminoglycoside phosphotransferase (APT) family kinase protein